MTATVSLDALLLNREPVSLIEAKLHLRLAVTADEAAAYTTEDTMLSRLIEVARDEAEHYTGLSLVTQTHIEYFADWPAGDYLVLPYPPLSSVTELAYMIDGDTTWTVVAAATYDVDTTTTPGRITLVTSETWPTDTLRPATPIRVTYVCGYEAHDVPQGIKQAMLLRLTDLYEQRGQIVVGTTVNEIPRAVERLLDHYRVWEHL